MKDLLSRILRVLLPAPPAIAPDEEVVFVDVRTREEYAREHVAGATLIPHHEMERRWKELRDRREERILVYCLTGTRSRAATRLLRSKGFERVENAGGIGGLRRAGLEIERGSGR
ncbi:MAG TPA: rhodanese-like domain-containing protein [Longimicrobiales bacterium]|nr:rhodanese-like domain-containing protein [Longimicrobiales bacterium]